MASMYLPTPSPRKKSKHDQLQITDQQEKINQMVHAFYEKMKAKIGRALTKCQNRNVILCKELFDSLSVHPKQELYETIKLHDLIFNEIDLISEVVAEFLRKMETLQERLREELMLQKEKSVVKKEKEGESHIAILRKVSFKKESQTFKSRLMGLDTINKKLLKCEDEAKGRGFYFEIEGKRSQIVVQSYSKIWFQSKRRDYLLCYGNDKIKDQCFIFNDKLQKIAAFGSGYTGENMKFAQIGHYIYLVSQHRIVRINLFIDEQIVVKVLVERISRVQGKGNTLVLWCQDSSKHFMVIFLDQSLEVIDQSYLKLNVSTVLDHFTLKQGEQILYFLTKSYNEQVDLLKIERNRWVLVFGDVGSVVEAIPHWVDQVTQQVVFRLSNNKFLRYNGSALSSLQVEIDQSEGLRSCAILGEYLYALSENGKSMLQCHYQPSPSLSS